MNPMHRDAHASVVTNDPLQDKRVQFVLLRFVLLDVCLRLWGVVGQGLSAVAGGGLLVAQQVGWNFERAESNPLMLVAFGILFVLTNAVPWILLIGIGWPLLRDLNQLLNVSIPGLLTPWRRSVIGSP
jgi:hypothetical protein